MGFLDWFKTETKTPHQSFVPLEERLEQLEQESRRAGAGFKWGALNRAGDLCLRQGEREQALQYYGRTIDSLLADGQREAARGVANKISRVHPDTVRTLCTLTWLDLAVRHVATALLHLRDYVEAAVSADEGVLAAEQILKMARISPDLEFVEAAADALDQLNRSENARMVREWAGSGGSPDVIADQEELERACYKAAIGSNKRS